MDLTNCKAEIAIVYSSVTGNTKQVAEILYGGLLKRGHEACLYEAADFLDANLGQYKSLMLGTYTWGSGEIPREMQDVYRTIESAADKHLVTGVFGTGDSFFPHYCGAVDRFRDMLYVRTTLAATLKIELMPQEQDHTRCQKFLDAVLKRMDS